jgi:hypothetical protein
MSDLSNDAKKHTTKSRETIPLSFDGFILYKIAIPALVYYGLAFNLLAFLLACLV